MTEYDSDSHNIHQVITDTLLGELNKYLYLSHQINIQQNASGKYNR